MKKVSIVGGAFLAGMILSGSVAFAASYVKAALTPSTIMAGGKIVSKVAALSYDGKVYLQSEAIDAALRAAKIPFTQKGATLIIEIPKKGNPPSSTASSNTADQYGLSYGNLAINSNTSAGVTSVDGQATNHSKQSYSAIMITVSFFDKNGKLLGTADGAVQGLAPGQTKTFEAVAFNNYPTAVKAVCQTTMAV